MTIDELLQKHNIVSGTRESYLCISIWNCAMILASSEAKKVGLRLYRETMYEGTVDPRNVGDAIAQAIEKLT